MFSYDSRRIISGSSDHTIKIWFIDNDDGKINVKCIKTLLGHTNNVNSVQFSSDNSIIVSGSSDGTIKIWSIIDYEKMNVKYIHTISGHKYGVYRTEISPDARKIASCGIYDNNIKIWSIDDNDGKLNIECLYTLEHTNTVCIRFSPDSTKIVSGSFDKIIKIWSSIDDILNVKCHTLLGHTKWISDVQFSPDASRIISGSIDGTLKIWSVDDNEETYDKCLYTLSEYSGKLSNIYFGSNNSSIAIGSYDGTIKILDISEYIPLPFKFKFAE